MFYEPKKGHPFSIDPYKSLIFPRPIGWISTISKKGIPNLAPYSYFNAVADYPPQVMFSEEASISNNKYKDSLSNIFSTKEFVVNWCTSRNDLVLVIQGDEYDKFGRVLGDVQDATGLGSSLVNDIISNFHGVAYRGQNKEDIRLAHLENRIKLNTI